MGKIIRLPHLRRPRLRLACPFFWGLYLRDPYLALCVAGSSLLNFDSWKNEGNPRFNPLYIEYDNYGKVIFFPKMLTLSFPGNLVIEVSVASITLMCNFDCFTSDLFPKIQIQWHLKVKWIFLTTDILILPSK